MKLKPFVNISFCYACHNPVPRVGLSLRTGFGNLSASSPFYCPKCAAKRKQFEKKLASKGK